MKKTLLFLLTAITMFFFPKVNFGQAPALGSTSSYAVFTANGAFNNLGATQITGDIGTNVGAFSGFPPGVVIGQTHIADASSAQAATDVDIAYSSFGVACSVIGTTLGNNQLLMPNTYCTGAASTLNGNLILDAQGNPNALFIIKIGGALSTTTSSSVTLVNSASACNVYWQVNGAVSLGINSNFVGTILANGAISLAQGASLSGRALSRCLSLHEC